MSAISSGSSAAGSRPDGRRVVLALLCALAACARAPTTASDLLMPVGRAPAYDSVETRFVVTRGDKDSAMDRALEQMEKAGVFSAAEYRYLARTGGGSIKVRVELFVDEAAARANWGKRHHPQALAMTQAFDAGDEGWIYRDQMAGVRVGRAIFEFRTKGAAPDLPGFGRSYAQFASGVLRR